MALLTCSRRRTRRAPAVGEIVVDLATPVAPPGELDVLLASAAAELDVQERLTERAEAELGLIG